MDEKDLEHGENEDFVYPDSAANRRGNRKWRTHKSETVDPRSSNSTEGTSVSCLKAFRSLFDCKYVRDRYSIFSFFFNIAAIGFYIFDLVTDWLNAFVAYYFRIGEEDQDYLFYFGLTIAVIVIPAFLIAGISLLFEHSDVQNARNCEEVESEQDRRCCCKIFWYLSHALQLGPVYRYFSTIYFGLKSRYMQSREGELKKYDYKWKGSLADATFIRLLESLLEAAPQVVLQLYIIIRTYNRLLFITVISVCFSGLGMSLSFVGYQRALRDSLPDKKQLSLLASICMGIYITFFNLSRTLALALLLNVNFWAWLTVIVLHWLLMTYAISRRKTVMCGGDEGQCEACPCSCTCDQGQCKACSCVLKAVMCGNEDSCKESAFTYLMGFCYIFSYVNVHDSDDKFNLFRMLLYYYLMFMENVVIALVWFSHRNPGSLLSTIYGKQSAVADLPASSVPSPTSTFQPGSLLNSTIYGEQSTVADTDLPDSSVLYLLLVVVFSFILGLIFMTIFYVFLHPKAPTRQRKVSEQSEKQSEQGVERSVQEPAAHQKSAGKYYTD